MAQRNAPIWLILADTGGNSVLLKLVELKTVSGQLVHFSPEHVASIEQVAGQPKCIISLSSGITLEIPASSSDVIYNIEEQWQGMLDTE